jgi:hypothetical protein
MAGQKRTGIEEIVDVVSVGVKIFDELFLNSHLFCTVLMKAILTRVIVRS